VTDSDNTATVRIERTDEATVTRHLRRLATAYPAFRFSHESVGRKDARWVAARRERMAPGLCVAITDDLLELYAAPQRDKARHAW
jgi:hypothetical protein